MYDLGTEVPHPRAITNLGHGPANQHRVSVCVRDHAMADYRHKHIPAHRSGMYQVRSNIAFKKDSLQTNVLESEDTRPSTNYIDETDNLNRPKTNVCVPGTCFGVRILNSSGGFQYSGVPVCATLYTGIVQGTGSIDNNWVTTTTIKMALTIEILVAPRDFTGIIEGGGTGIIGSLARCTLGVEESNLFTAFTI